MQLTINLSQINVCLNNYLNYLKPLDIKGTDHPPLGRLQRLTCNKFQDQPAAPTVRASDEWNSFLELPPPGAAAFSSHLSDSWGSRNDPVRRSSCFGSDYRCLRRELPRLWPSDASPVWFPGGSAASDQSCQCSRRLRREAGMRHQGREFKSALRAENTIFTYQWNPVWRSRQNLVENQLHHGDGQQHCDFKAELFTTVVRDKERGHVKAQEEEDGQQKVDNVEQRASLHTDLRREARDRSDGGQIG